MKGKAEEPTRPPLGEIRIIVRRTSTRNSSKTKKTYLLEVQNVQITRRTPMIIREDEPAITLRMKMQDEFTILIMM